MDAQPLKTHKRNSIKKSPPYIIILLKMIWNVHIENFEKLCTILGAKINVVIQTLLEVKQVLSINMFCDD